MSVAYEPRALGQGGIYPAIGEPHEVSDVPDMQDHEVQSVHSMADVQTADTARFEETDVATEVAVVLGGYTAPSPPIMADSEPALEPEPVDPIHSVVTPPSPAVSVVIKAGMPSPPPAGTQRIKAIPKPERQPTKDLDGKYICTFPACAEETRAFSRRCEWSKHMDKHDRPYKCTADGCQKLPGFTYSGGLLRHEREVHSKHGGPKNPLHCPHPTCKRHSGKGFSRQENLNEHLRRVHTSNSSPATALAQALPGAGGDLSDAGSDTAAAAAAAAAAAGGVGLGAAGLSHNTSNGNGSKRKRESSSIDDGDLREEVKRLRQENEELSRQVEAQNRQTAMMMQQIQDLQEALRPPRVDSLG